MDFFDFSDQCVLITGATGGIGRSIFQNFYDKGAKVCATSTSEDKLNKFLAEFDDKSRVFGIVIDMKNHEEVEKLCTKSLELMGSLTTLVCNAGITKDTLALRMKTEDFQEVIDVNLTSNFILNREAGKVMMKNSFGRVINITSVVSFSGNAGQASYIASKAGLGGMTKTMAIESATRGVTYNCIAPGFIETPMTDVLSDTIKDMISKKIPMKRQGQPQDIAYAALFLASKSASYITGTTIHVNGGMWM